MRLTSKGRYAVTAMLDVALNSEAGPVPLADISERQGSRSPIWNSCSPDCVKMDWFPAFVAQAAVICWVKTRAVSQLAK
jgi:hypothetical protein